MSDEAKPPTDLTQDRKIQTVAGIMQNISDEIEAIKSGDLQESRARLVMKGRALQLQGAQLYIQAARLDSKLRPGIAKQMGHVVETKAIPENND